MMRVRVVASPSLGKPGDEIVLKKKIDALIKDAKEPNNSVDP